MAGPWEREQCQHDENMSDSHAEYWPMHELSVRRKISASAVSNWRHKSVHGDPTL